MEKTEKRIEKSYEKAFSGVGHTQISFPVDAKIEMSQMVEQMARTDSHIGKILSTNWTPAQKGGRVAEEVLAETYNYDAILHDSKNRAITDRYSEWAETGFRKNNDGVADILGMDGQKNVIYKAQSKFDKTPESTAAEMGRLGNDGTPKYGDADALIGPSNQINPKDGTVSVGDHALAKSQAEEARGNIGQAKASKIVHEKNTDHVAYGGRRGSGLKKDQADEIGQGTEKGQKIHDDIQNKYANASTLKHMTKAAVGAAAMSAVCSGVFNTITYCRLAKEGKISEKEAVIRIVGETAASAADSAIKASANVGIQSFLVRYGAQKLTVQVTREIAKRSLTSLARTNAVTLGVVCGIDVIKDLVGLYIGKITTEEFETRNGKNLLTTAAGLAGSTIGVALIGSLSITGAAIVGGIAGALIAGCAMQFAIENHIEKPYRELVENTSILLEAETILHKVTQQVVVGQKMFSAFLIEEAQLDSKTQTQFDRIAMSSQEMKKSIDRL